MKSQHLLFAAIGAILLSGCAVQTENFSITNVGVSQKKIDAELKSTTVAGSSVHKLLWQQSVIESLDRMMIFQDDATLKVNLSITILTVTSSGGNKEVAAQYEIIDRKTGDIIFTKDISTSAKIGAYNPSYGGVEYLNLAVQDNIRQFLKALETVDVRKPMFPAKVGGTK